MEEIIKLKSRYKENNYLKKLKKADNSESKTFTLKVSSPHLKVGKLEDGRDFIDPVGGPMIIVGESLPEANAVVKYINYTIGYGYTITFE